MSAAGAAGILIVGYGVVHAFTGTTTQTHYVLGTVQKNTVIASVSASGQVSASNNLDLKPKVSGTVVYVGVTPGEKVEAGTLLVELDATDAQKAVRDAEVNLQSAKLSYAKLTESADPLTRAQTENSLASAYGSSRSDIVNAYFELQSMLADLTDINSRIGSNQFLPGNIGSSSGEPLRQAALKAYDAAQAAYKPAFADYSSLTISTTDVATLGRVLKETAGSTEQLLNAVKSASTFLQWYIDLSKSNNQNAAISVSTDLTSLTSYAGRLGSSLSSLTSDEGSIEEKQLSLTKLDTGADTLDVQSSQLSVTKAENALQDAQSNLEQYFVRAPFAGTVAAVSVKKFDSASGGTAVATLITPEQIAELSLNEVDAAKIKTGDQATLTFDAIDGLTLTGKVVQIDTIGTVTQGVVSYTVKIAFDTQDSRIKSGMTVNAAIITDAHADVLTVPSSAVKTASGASYVLTFNPELADVGTSQGVVSAQTPVQVPVEIGISDDTNTEITSGLTEGQQIIVRTISGSTQVTTQSAPSLFGGAGGVRTGTGGATRTTTR